MKIFLLLSGVKLAVINTEIFKRNLHLFHVSLVPPYRKPFYYMSKQY